MDNTNGLEQSREARKVEVLEIGLKNSQAVIQEFANCLERKNKEIEDLKALVETAFREGEEWGLVSEFFDEEAWESSESVKELEKLHRHSRPETQGQLFTGAKVDLP